MTKREKVLETPELLELILLQLPLKDLLLAQRICRSFNSLIRTSPVLQEALFFRPRSAPFTPRPKPSEHLRSHPGGKPTTESWQRNPLLVSAFPPWFDRSVPESTFGAPFHRPEAFETLPLAAATCTERRRRHAFLRPEASWRRMLVTQPPPAVTELELLRMFHGMGGDSLEAGRVVALPPSPSSSSQEPSAPPLTMGALYDITCREVLGSSHNSFPIFRVQWHGAERRIVLFTHHTIQCVIGAGNDPMVWKGYFSDAYEDVPVEWQLRSFDEDPQDGGRVPDDIVKAGDYESEEKYMVISVVSSSECYDAKAVLISDEVLIARVQSDQIAAYWRRVYAGQNEEADR